MGRILVIFLLLGLLGNLAVLDYKQFVKPGESISPPNDSYIADIESLKDEVARLKEGQSAAPVSSDSGAVCPDACVSLIGKSSPAKSSGTISPASQKGEYVIPLGTGTVMKVGSWENVDTAQAVIDTGNYGSIAETYFEAIMHIPTGEGEVKARLVDVTTPSIFDGNQLSATSTTGQLVTTKVALRPGSKLYRVQLFNSIASGVLDQARIRIVTK